MVLQLLKVNKDIEKFNVDKNDEDLQVKIVDTGGGRVSDDIGYCWVDTLVTADAGRELVVDDAVANCCCFAVNSTGIGSVNASSTLGNGPRGLCVFIDKIKIFIRYRFNSLLFSNSTFRYLSKTRLQLINTIHQLWIP